MNRPEYEPSNPLRDETPSREVVLDWVAQARGGDENAFGELVKMYHQKIYGLAYGMVNNADDAKDLAQQAWIKVWNKLDTFKEESRFYTWLYRIASNVCLDFIRKKSRRRETSMEERLGENPVAEVGMVPESEARPDRDLQQRELREMFLQALDALTPEHKLALMLREVDGLSYDEIAKITKSRKGTVMSRLFYARKAIQDKMRALH